MEKMECHLVGSKRLYLSKDRWLSLIKIIVSNLPTFSSLFPIHVGVAQCLEKLLRDFLLGDRLCGKRVWM